MFIYLDSISEPISRFSVSQIQSSSELKQCLYPEAMYRNIVSPIEIESSHLRHKIFPLYNSPSIHRCKKRFLHFLLFFLKDAPLTFFVFGTFFIF